MTIRMCSGHAIDLAKEIKRKGMGHLVYNDPEHVEHFVQRWIHGVSPREEFNPFVVAVLEITKKAQDIVPPLMLEGGTRCPICCVSRHLHRDVAVDWIDGVSDLMLLTAKVNELVT